MRTKLAVLLVVLLAAGTLCAQLPKSSLGPGTPTTLPPSGAAGGDLAGTYPNPTLAYVATNPQTGTTYAIVPGDRGKLVTLTNANPIAVSIAVATGFTNGWEATVLNSGAGTATITPATSTIEDAATLVLTTGQAAKIWSNGANYRAARIGKVAAATVADSTTGNAGTVTNGLYTTTPVSTLGLPFYCADAGSNDSYACNLSPVITSYTVGQAYWVKANTANTGAATLTLNSIAGGAKTIVKLVGDITTALADNDIRAGQWVAVVYDGTNMQMLSASGNEPPTAAALSATLTEARFPALDGAVSNSVGDLTTTLAAAYRTRSFGASFDGGGSALTAGKTVYVTVPHGCTVQAWNILVDAGTATVDIWRHPTGTAIPLAEDAITGTGAGRPAIAADTAIHSTTLTGWSSLAISANDILAFNLQAVATATFLNFVVECLQ